MTKRSKRLVELRKIRLKIISKTALKPIPMGLLERKDVEDVLVLNNNHTGVNLVLKVRKGTRKLQKLTS